jgi:hypothetical protein
MSNFGEEYVLCHSWYRELGRLLPKDSLGREDQLSLDYLIDTENMRGINAKVEVLLDYA